MSKISIPSLGRIPGVWGLVKMVRRWLDRWFFSSQEYWVKRYVKGGDSAAPKFPLTCAFKARQLNDFAREHNVRDAIEFGCGEGIQTGLLKFEHYTGCDVSPEAIRFCKQRFGGDTARTFKVMTEYQQEQADMALSLDVIYHLVEDRVFDAYMRTVFAAARRFVGVFAPDENRPRSAQAPHVRFRKYSDWIRQNATDWDLILDVPNPHHIEEGKTEADPLSHLRIYRKRRPQ